MLGVLKTSFKNWLCADPFTQSAAAAYYAIFSMPGLLIILMALAAFFFEQQQIESYAFQHIREIFGYKTAEEIRKIAWETGQDNKDVWAMIAGGATVLFGATGLFAQLQRSLNRIWEVEVKKSTEWLAFIKARLVSFGLILIIGFLMLISLFVTSILTIFREWLATQFSTEWALVLIILNLVLSFLLITALFTLMFKILPDAKVEWRVAFFAGALTTVLFRVGEYALNYYFEYAQPQSSFGAAGSIILFMLWISYSCMILLIGAEFAKVFAEQKNERKAEAKDIAKKKIRKD